MGGKWDFLGGGMKKRDFFPSGKNSRPGGGGGCKSKFFCVLPYTFTINSQEGGEGGSKGGF